MGGRRGGRRGRFRRGLLGARYWAGGLLGHVLGGLLGHVLGGGLLGRVFQRGLGREGFALGRGGLRICG